MNYVYVSGGMTGYEDNNFPAFRRAAEDLRNQGYLVFDPSENTPDIESYNNYLALDLPEVCKCDIVACLPGWQLSKGANIEVFVALSLGKRVVDYPYMKPILPYPAFDAFWTCQDVMREGLLKHKAHSWLFESPINHSAKAARHSMTYMLQQQGLSPNDGEDHTRMAVTRAAFARSQKLYNEDDAVLDRAGV